MNQIKNMTIMTFLLMLSTGASAAITCSTPRNAKVISMDENKVSISRPLQFTKERSIASVDSARTKLVGSGFTKVLFHDGAKHIIHVEDKKSFSELDDYLIIRSAEGHEMTYPLECQQS